VLEPTAVFFTLPRWEYIAGWADGQGRPVLLPCAIGAGDQRSYGDTGQERSGLHVYTDPNILSLGTTSTDQALVADPTEVYVWRSPQPIIEIIPQYGAANREPLIRAYGYAGCIVRYPLAVQTIAGTSMTTPTF
jgi:hypothetical protein